MQIDGHRFTIDVCVKSTKVYAKAIGRLSKPARKVVDDTLYGDDEIRAGSGLLSINLYGVCQSIAAALANIDTNSTFTNASQYPRQLSVVCQNDRWPWI